MYKIKINLYLILLKHIMHDQLPTMDVEDPKKLHLLCFLIVPQNLPYKHLCDLKLQIYLDHVFQILFLQHLHAVHESQMYKDDHEDELL